MQETSDRDGWEYGAELLEEACGTEKPSKVSRYKTQESKEKNRQAQQRFREKKRVEHERQQQELSELEAELERLQLDNQRLADAAKVNERVLAVRDAMLLSLSLSTQQPQHAQQQSQQLEPLELMMQQALPEALSASFPLHAGPTMQMPLTRAEHAQQQQDPQHPSSIPLSAPAPLSSPLAAQQPFPTLHPLSAADLALPLPAQHQAGALEDPSPSWSDTLVCDPKAALGGSQGGGGSGSGGQGSGSSGVLEECGYMPEGGARQVAGGEGRGRGAAVLAEEGKTESVAEDLEAISLPQVDNPGICDLVLGMNSPDDFMEAWRVWQLEVAHRLQEADASGLEGAKEMDALKQTVDYMVIMFWYASYLKPGFTEHVMVQMSAPPAVAEELWRKVAAQVHLTPEEGSRLQYHWNLCSKRVAQAEVSRLRWLAIIAQQQQEQQQPQQPPLPGAAGVPLATHRPPLPRRRPWWWLRQPSGQRGQGVRSRGVLQHAARLRLLDARGINKGCLGASWKPGQRGRGRPTEPSLSSVFANALEVSEAVSGLKEACQAKELAVKDFLGKLDTVFCTVTKARINVLSTPYFPDFLAVARHILYPDDAEEPTTSQGTK